MSVRLAASVPHGGAPAPLDASVVSTGVQGPPCAVIRHGELEAVVVDNRPVHGDPLPGHRAGYNGLGALRWRGGESPIVPQFAGLNFEHVYDGTMQSDEVLYAPRYAPTQLQVIDGRTVELHQAATPHWEVASRTRFTVLDGDAIEMSFECVPSARTWAHDYLGFFWASYLAQPESPAIHFRGPLGWEVGDPAGHGAEGVHRSVDDAREFAHEPALAERLGLLFGCSTRRFVEPWYFGVHQGCALAYVFRPVDRVRFAQSPNGGGPGNPAWDFQWYIDAPQPQRTYRFVLRLAMVPWTNPDQVRAAVQPHLAALARDERTLF